jgi:hypothetical protein
MTYLLVGFLIVAAFIGGFFVGKKHGYRLGEIEAQIKAEVEVK